MTAAATLRRHKTTHGRASMGTIMLGALSPAYRSGRTIFPSRVFDPDEVQRVLKSGHQSRKIGKFVTKGPRRGWATDCCATCGLCWHSNRSIAFARH